MAERVSDIVVRPVRVTDAGQILTVQRAAFVSEALIYGTCDIPPLTQTLDELEAELRDADGFVATLYDRVIGAIRTRENGQLLQIGRIAVAPDMQGEGIGRALLAAAEDATRCAHAELFTGSLSATNIRLYQECGYDESERVDNDDGTAQVFMRKTLRPDRPPAVAVIGIGRMGLPIALRLQRAGYAVRVFDVDTARLLLAESLGLIAARSAGAAAEQADVLLTILPGAPAVAEVMLDADRLIEKLRPGSCWLDLTSSDPRVGERIAARAAARGVETVSAPMAGGVGAATAAGLGFFVGGSRDARARVTPLLNTLASPDGIRIAGDDIGSGYSAKLLINLLWFGQVAAVSEALLLGQRLGLTPASLCDLIAGSAADSAFTQRHLPLLLEGDYMTTFGLRECADELDILASLADEHGSSFCVSAAVVRLHHEALDEFGTVDGEMLIARLLEERDGTRLRR